MKYGLYLNLRFPNDGNLQQALDGLLTQARGQSLDPAETLKSIERAKAITQ